MCQVCKIMILVRGLPILVINSLLKSLSRSSTGNRDTQLPVKRHKKISKSSFVGESSGVSLPLLKGHKKSLASGEISR